MSGDDHFLQPDNDPTEGALAPPESPIDVKLHEFGQLLDDVLNAFYDCEIRGLSNENQPEHHPSVGFYFKYKLARERLMGVMSAMLNKTIPLNEDPSGQRREPMAPDPLDDKRPF